jgi:hypothetical protein
MEDPSPLLVKRGPGSDDNLGENIRQFWQKIEDFQEIRDACATRRYEKVWLLPQGGIASLDVV